MTFAKTFWGQTDAHKPAPPGKEEMQTVPANLGKKAFLSIFSSFASPHKRRNDFLRWQDNGHGVPQRFIPPWVECSTPTAGPAPQGTFSTPTCSGRGCSRWARAACWGLLCLCSGGQKCAKEHSFLSHRLPWGPRSAVGVGMRWGLESLFGYKRQPAEFSERLCLQVLSKACV